MTKVIETKRLLLRPARIDDAPEMARLIGDWDVMRWLTRPPWPYGKKDAEWFIGDISSVGSRAILTAGRFAGVVGIRGELGYWLGRKYWGQGIMSEAACAVIAEHFATSDKNLDSGYLLGNESSANVLAKLGFRATEVKTDFSGPLDANVQVQKMQLTMGQWRVQHAP